MNIEPVTLKTASYLFQNGGGQFRAIPFYELSIDEWVIFENGHPKYLLDFNRRNKPLVQDLTKRQDNVEDVDDKKLAFPADLSKLLSYPCKSSIICYNCKDD